MFTAVYDDDSVALQGILDAYPDVLLGSWDGMSILRYAFAMHPCLEKTEASMLLLNRFTLLTQRHGPVEELKDVFADALVALCEHTQPQRVEAALTMCFENYLVAHGAPWLEAVTQRLAKRRQPVGSSQRVLEVLACEALGPRAELPAIRSLCAIWGADLAMMAVARILGLKALPPQLCGRGRRISKALLAELEACPLRAVSPQHAALHSEAEVIAGGNIQAKVDRLSMLFDQDALCSVAIIRSDISSK